MDYEGIVYRPPSEARSLIIQVTIGCAHNTCGFCNMYKEKKFRIRSLAEILADLTEVSHNPYAPYIEKVFLADGDALVMKTEDLLVILDAIHRLYPGVKRVASYGTAQDILRKSEEELIRLREAGLGIVYVGAESGDNEILKYINKGVTAEQTIEAGQKLKRCGIATSVTLISGLGGRSKVEEMILAYFQKEQNDRSCLVLCEAHHGDEPGVRILPDAAPVRGHADVCRCRGRAVSADNPG